MAVDEKTKRALETFREQSKKYIETLPKKKRKKREARLRRLLRLMKMAALGKYYKMPRKKHRISGPLTEYARRTVAPKTK